MLSLAVLCAFHYFLADILGNNLFLSLFFSCLLSFPFLKSITSFCLVFTQCFRIPVDQWVRDCKDKIKAFLLCLKKGVGGHKAQSYCLISMLFEKAQGSENGQDFEAGSAHLPLGISCLDSEQRGGSQWQINGVTSVTSWLGDGRNQMLDLWCSVFLWLPSNICQKTSITSSLLCISFFIIFCPKN